MTMPTIDVSKVQGLSEAQMYWVKTIVKKNGSLYASRPKKASGSAQYIWRDVVFALSSKSTHQCMPVTSDWYIEKHEYASHVSPRADAMVDSKYPRLEDHYRKQDYINEVLKPVVDAIINSVPKTEWHGINRWGKALGYI